MVSKKTFDLDASLGDINSVMHNQGVADLSWLAVDEEEYRAAEALPKQNLDIIPELQKALAMGDDGVPAVIPLKPHVQVNRNPLDAPAPKADMTAPIRNRVAHMVMAGLPTPEVRTRLALEFGPQELHEASSAVNEVLFERGLLGSVYVDARHFPRCANSQEEQRFARAACKGALCVLAKEECAGCSCNHGGCCQALGGQRIVDEVPYGPKLAAHYALRLSAEKRPIDLNAPGAGQLPASRREWKERMRAAFNMTPVAPRPDGVQTAHTHHEPAKPALTAADFESFWARRQAALEAEPAPSPAYLKHARRMMEGRDDMAALAASGDPALAALASEYGLLGHTYLDLDALGGCRQAVALIKSRNDGFTASRNGGIGVVPDFVVRRSPSCPQCGGLPDGACAELSRISAVVQRRPPADKRTFVRALIRAVGEGRIAAEDARTAARNVKDGANWTALTAQANLYRPAESPPSECPGVRVHACAPADPRTAEMDPEEVRRTISHMMNSGLSGRALQDAVLRRYSREDLRQVPEVGAKASADDGVQGSYFVDPTAYRDYGRGCGEGASHFRKRGALHVLAGGKCTGCTLVTHPGWCSKYSKDIITQVPDSVRKTAAEARRAPPPPVHEPVENPVERYELASELPLEIGGERPQAPEIDLSGPVID